MLGDDYAIAGHVIRGEARGRKLGFPTMNIALKKRFIPRKGVYAAKLEVAGKMFDAVVNIGVKPTFGVHTPLLEAHAFGLAEEVYGRYAMVSLKHFIRDEKKFEGADALKEQITHDTHIARTILAR
jgi:riboflavin kinase/FMN adenylyltransferase